MNVLFSVIPLKWGIVEFYSELMSSPYPKKISLVDEIQGDWIRGVFLAALLGRGEMQDRFSIKTTHFLLWAFNFRYTKLN